MIPYVDVISSYLHHDLKNSRFLSSLESEAFSAPLLV